MTIYDFYSAFRIKNKSDIDNLTNGVEDYEEVSDMLSRIMLLNTSFGVKQKLPDLKGRPDAIYPYVYARVGEADHPSGLKALIHSSSAFSDHTRARLCWLRKLGIDMPIDISALPKGSWVIEFPITLAEPFISRDDVPLFIIENPVKKDKVFGVPITSATAWKGNLRWSMMKNRLEPKMDRPDEFAETRLQHTLLFGTEKGMEEESKGWTRYLDRLCPSATEQYRNKLKERSGIEATILAGMLHFYPTFWDRTDMEVINPHDRERRTGTNPIYFEVVSTLAAGVFRLLYIPLHYLAESLANDEFRRRVAQDLSDVIEGLKQMMIVYGFSAKKSIGYGVIKDKWDKKDSRLIVKEFSNIEKFGDFIELTRIVRELGSRHASE